MKLYSILILFLFVGFTQAQVDPLNIVIDAEKDDFYNGLTDCNDGLIWFPARSGLDESSIPSLPDDDNDCSALLWSAWDTTYIYYYAEVTDDIIFVNNPTAYQNDMIEVKYDPDPSLGGTSGALQTRISAYGEDYAQDPTGVNNINDEDNLMDASGNAWEPTIDDYARAEMENGDGYILEWRVPLRYMNTTSRFLTSWNIGDVFGCAINVGDNDDTQRDHMLQWSAGHLDAAWSDVSLHGTVTFLADNKLQYVAINYDETVVNDSAEAWYFLSSTSVEPEHNIPSSFSLKQNYPNPFNPTTTIRYELDRTDKVSLTIYNVTGEVVRNLLSGITQNPGTHEIVWDAKDNNGTEVSSGIYFYQIKQGTSVANKKMVLMR